MLKIKKEEAENLLSPRKEASSFMKSISWINQFCEELSKPQRKVLALIVDALLTKQECILSSLAEHLVEESGVGIKHCIKRIYRFLKNDNFDDEEVTRAIINMIWPRIESWDTIPVIIDWTPNEKRNQWKSLFAEVPLRGRGIPLMSWSFPKDSLGHYLSQNQLERDFVRRLFSLLPDDQRIVLIADRGFGRASFLRFLDEIDIGFVIRISMNTWVESRQHTGELGELPIKDNTAYSLTDCYYKKDERVPLSKVIVAYEGTVKDDGSKDPWFLATNEKFQPSRGCRLYSKRMTIEEDFKEAKSRLEWDNCRIRKRKHYNRLVTVIILALVFAVLVGTVIYRRKTLLRKVCRMKNGRPDKSMTHAALKLLQQGLDNLKFLMRARLYSPI